MADWPVTISLPMGLTVGGVTTWALQLADALGKAGRRARIVAHGLTEGGHPVDRSGEFEIIEAPSLDKPANWLTCLRIYRDLTPTILLPFTLADSYAIAAALATVEPERIRVVGWIHSDNPYDYATLAYYEPLIHCIPAASRHCAEELGRRMPTRSDSVERIPYGVHVPSEISRPPLTRRPLRLIYGGRMEHTGKRVLHFVDLARKLDQRGVRFELRLVGDGPQSAELERRIADAVGSFAFPQNRIWLEPAMPFDRMVDVWSWADVSLVNSIREGFCLSMVESMACGCVPVVSHVASGVGDILQEGRNGLTFDVDDIDALSGHIEWLSRNESELRRMSHTARVAAESHCGFDLYFKRAIDVLDRVAASAPRPWSPRKPLHMNAPDAGCDATVPSDAANRMSRLLRDIRNSDDGPVAIFGAGNHTRALASTLADAAVDIVAVIDDDHTLLGRRLWGWPIVSPSAAAETGAKTVVISSWLHEDDIQRQHAECFTAAGLRLAPLYAPSRAAPSPQPC